MNNEKTKSVVAYIFGIIGGLIVLFMEGSEQNTKIHAAQSITISIGFYLIRTIYSFTPFNIPYFYMIITAVYLIAIISGIVKAANDDDPNLPIIGDFAKSIFKKQIENS